MGLRKTLVGRNSVGRLKWCHARKQRKFPKQGRSIGFLCFVPSMAIPGEEGNDVDWEALFNQETLE